MPPKLASILFVGLAVYLFRRDFREKPNITRALWLPTLWLGINMSRYVSVWLHMFGVPVSSSVEEGTPVDACFYFGLIASGIYVLNQRRVGLAEIIRRNPWITMFLVYCLISILWSDFPFTAIKRWIKTLGHPVMALVVLTEPDPRESLIRLLKRLAFFFVPISILFIKYYPEWGRSYSVWTGEVTIGGVAGGKNQLGIACLILLYFFIWYFLQVRRMDQGKERRNEFILCVAFITMITWLFYISNSKTPLVALFLGSSIMVLAGARWVNRRLIGVYIIVSVVLILIAEEGFGISEFVLHLLGRNATLTDRTYLWQDLLKMDINPVLGTGFESFWLGDRLAQIWQLHTWRPNQAHNGYLETYINLGLVGLSLLVFQIGAAWRKIQYGLLSDFDFGRFRLGFLLAVIPYNWTEASFKALHPVWTVFYLIALDPPRSQIQFVDISSQESVPAEKPADILTVGPNG